MASTDSWKRVVFAVDCEPDGYCPECQLATGEEIDYADCPCPGPTQEDEFEYKEMGGRLFARRRSLPA
jgi:hypothetical protein